MSFYVQFVDQSQGYIPMINTLSPANGVFVQQRNVNNNNNQHNQHHQHQQQQQQQQQHHHDDHKSVDITGKACGCQKCSKQTSKKTFGNGKSAFTKVKKSTNTLKYGKNGNSANLFRNANYQKINHNTNLYQKQQHNTNHWQKQQQINTWQKPRQINTWQKPVMSFGKTTLNNNNNNNNNGMEIEVNTKKLDQSNSKKQFSQALSGRMTFFEKLMD